MSNTPIIYMDYASTTPLDPRVFEAMRPWFEMHVGNASSTENIHGLNAKKAIDDARLKIANAIGAQPCEIIFASGATEANNMALLGLRSYLKDKRKTHTVSSPTEHSSILEPLKLVGNTSYSNLLPCGMADGAFVLNEITPETGLISIQMVNNETGVINPLKEIKEGIKDKDIIFHSDASQALGRIAFNVNELGLDMATLSGHKIYGPEGIGVLYIKQDLQKHVTPLILGGGQQSGLRSGSLPTALIVGMAEAVTLAIQSHKAETEKAEYFYNLLRQKLDRASIVYSINGHDQGSESLKWRVPQIINIHFPNIENEWLLEAIDGISFSTGSACNKASSKNLSHVLTAMGLPTQHITQSVRLSFGRFTTEEDIITCAEIFIDAITTMHQLIETKTA